MKTYKPYLAGSTMALMLIAGQAVAQTAGAPADSTSFVTQQPASESLASGIIGQNVASPGGEIVGDINDLLFDKSGRISTVVIGVGGILGIGGKNVAVPFSLLTIESGATGERAVSVALSAEALKNAPDFKSTEKTTFMKAREKAGEIGSKAMEKAGELKDQATKKFEEMKKDEPKKQ
jgi:hypothetical protein